MGKSASPALANFVRRPLMAVSTAATMTQTRTWLTKVPAITATFWVIKVLSTTIGETLADYLTVNVGLGPAVTDGLMIAVLAGAPVIQLPRPGKTPGDFLFWGGPGGNAGTQN